MKNSLDKIGCLPLASDHLLCLRPSVFGADFFLSPVLALLGWGFVFSIFFRTSSRDFFVMTRKSDSKMPERGRFWMSSIKVQTTLTRIAEIEKGFTEYCGTHFYNYDGYEENGGGSTHKMTILWGPVELSPIIGEAVHNLRSALDLAATELARATSGNDKEVYFPTAVTEDQLDEIIKKKNFHKAGDDAVALLKTFKPFRGSSIPLRALHELNIEDKHKIFIPTEVVFAVEYAFQIKEDGIVLPENTWMKPLPTSFKLVFPQDSPFAGQEVVPTLKELVELVSGVLKAFSALVAARR